MPRFIALLIISCLFLTGCSSARGASAIFSTAQRLAWPVSPGVEQQFRRSPSPEKRWARLLDIQPAQSRRAKDGDASGGVEIGR